MRQDSSLRRGFLAIIICGSIILAASCTSGDRDTAAKETLENTDKGSKGDDMMNWTKLPHQIFSAF